MAACETRIHGAEHDPTIFSTPDAIGPKIAFITISNDNAFHPDLLRPDEGHKFVAVVSAEAVGLIEVVAAPSDAIRLTYDPDIQWPWVFESLYEKVLFEGCDDGTDSQFAGGIVVTGPGCYQLTATDLGTRESHTKQLEVGKECPT